MSIPIRIELSPATSPGQQTEPTIDVGDEGLHELIDDVEIVHRVTYCGV